jgi:hypothetical protein
MTLAARTYRPADHEVKEDVHRLPKAPTISSEDALVSPRTFLYVSRASLGSADGAGAAVDGDRGRGVWRRFEELGEVGGEGVVELSGDVALEAAHDLLLGLPSVVRQVLGNGTPKGPVSRQVRSRTNAAQYLHCFMDTSSEASSDVSGRMF